MVHHKQEIPFFFFMSTNQNNAVPCSECSHFVVCNLSAPLAMHWGGLAQKGQFNSYFIDCRESLSGGKNDRGSLFMLMTCGVIRAECERILQMFLLLCLIPTLNTEALHSQHASHTFLCSMFGPFFGDSIGTNLFPPFFFVTIFSLLIISTTSFSIFPFSLPIVQEHDVILENGVELIKGTRLASLSFCGISQMQLNSYSVLLHPFEVVFIILCCCCRRCCCCLVLL